LEERRRAEPVEPEPEEGKGSEHDRHAETEKKKKKKKRKTHRGGFRCIPRGGPLSPPQTTTKLRRI
jgi:hypothetical protein